MSELPAHVPRIIVGTERMGSVLPGRLGSFGQKETFRYLDGVFEAGCTALDVAASYQLGGTERLIGEWMRDRRNRDRIYLVGKGAHPYPVVKPNRLTPEDLTNDLEDSLRRLRTDRIDMYLVHRDSPGVGLEPIAHTLADFVRKGKIGAYGVSNWHHDRIGELDDLAQKASLPRPIASSPQFSLAAWTKPQWSGCVSITGDRRAHAWYRERQMTVLAWSPLGRGFFGGAKDTVYDSRENEARRDRVRQLAREKDRRPAEIALAWLFAQPFPVHAVVWSTSVANMKANIAAANVRLTESETMWLESGQRRSSAS